MDMGMSRERRTLSSRFFFPHKRRIFSTSPPPPLAQKSDFFPLRIHPLDANKK